ncbi:sensor of ECF-type sigma factor [uncultured Lutibacter sp.]|uniref:sensor of ECF-type sigma factor n=1 Tax=uncultured Lutibacter sp. TaxID=437739 RepID=UPI0026192AF0|nr:sensor of ECF-type sigma factor [uncultured Lutibacter sp.]
MKKSLFIFILLLAISFASNAQGRERIKALKATYITNSINLTPTEAEKFWPVYNKYSTKIQELKLSMESGMRKLKFVNSMNKLTEKEAEKIIDNRIDFEEKILELKISQTKELKKVISAIKILKLQKAERDFNRELLQEYGKRRGMNRN